MSGGLPTGNDPSEFDIGSYGILGATGIANLINRTQSNVESDHKAILQGSPGWGQASSYLFAGLFPDGSTPFPVLFLIAIMEQILGYVPLGRELLDLLLELGSFFWARWQDLADIIEDFIDFVVGLVGAFDLDAVIDALLWPIQVLQDLISGLGGSIIGDITAIINGAIAGITSLLTFGLVNLGGPPGGGMGEGEGALAELAEELATRLGLLKETADSAAEDSTEALGNWVSFLTGGSWANPGEAATDVVDAKADASEALGNWATWLGEGEWGDIAAAVTDFLGTKQTAETADSNATTALGNWTNFLSGGSWANAGEAAADINDTKSTASTAASNASTALGNWATWLGEGEWDSIADSVTDFLSTKSTAGTASSNASTALGNWTSFLSGGSWANPGAAATEITTTTSTASTAASNASTALGNWTTWLGEGEWEDVASAAADFLSTKSDAATAKSTAESAASDLGDLLGDLLSNPSEVIGTLAATNIPNLNANKITAGTLNADRIPTLAQSKITDLESDLSDIGSDAAEALGNWTEWLGEGEWSDIADSVADFLNTKSTASTASSNASTALGSWTSFLSGGSWANAGAAASDINSTKSTASTAASNASTALGNWTSFLSGGSWANPGAAASEITSTASTASTAASNASTALGNWTAFLGEGEWQDAEEAAADVADAKSTAAGAASGLSGLISGLLSNPSSLLGVLGTGNIPNLAASKITSGTFDTNRIPSLAASKITSGTFNEARIPTLAQSKITNLESDLGTALGNWTTLLSEGSWANVAAAAADILGAKSTADNVSNEVTDTQEGIVDNVLPGAGEGASGVGQAMQALAQTVLGLTQDVQRLQQDQSFDNFSGKTFVIDYSEYEDGESESVGVPLDLDYTGTGSGRSVIVNGVSTWDKVADGDVQVVGRYTDGETDTDYQWLQATAVGPMDVGATEAFCARMNDDKDSYVYIMGYRPTLFEFKCELGCVVDGVKTVFVTDVNATFSLNLQMRAGVGADPYRFQVYSGNTLIIDYTDGDEISEVGEDFRGFGFFATTANNGANAPASASRMSCTDNAPVEVPGSGARIYRESGTAVTVSSGVNLLPNNFFDTQGFSSSDISVNLTTGQFTVTNAGRYLITMRSKAASTLASNVDWVVYRNGNVYQRCAGGTTPRSVGGSTVVELAAGDAVRIGTDAGANYTNLLRGASGGGETYFSITRIDRS